MKIKKLITAGAFLGSLGSVGLFYLIDGQGHYLSRGFNWPDVPLRVIWSSALLLWTIILVLLGERRSLLGMACLAGFMLVIPDLLVALKERGAPLSYPLYNQWTLTATWWTAVGCLGVAVLLDVVNWWDDRRMMEAESTEAPAVE